MQILLLATYVAGICTHPDQFYTGNSPDYDWQNEQLKQEKK